MSDAVTTSTPGPGRSPEGEKTWLEPIGRGVATAMGIAFATGLVFVLVEGTSSLVLFSHRLLADPPVEDRRHARFDQVLGWVSNPNVYIPDMFGPGVYLRTNARAFRNDEQTDKEIPSGKLRVVCSGDSFTQGYGVNNKQAFCQRLSFQDARIEAVNMGQAGYGIDQAFLWYKRDGTRIDHDVQVFAFITDDFWRMQTAKYNGYAKPLLRLHNGSLVAENVPVRESSFIAPWVVRVQAAASELRMLAMVKKILRRASPGELLTPALDARTPEVALAIFTTLADINRSKGSTLVLVYLPTKWDYESQDPVTERTRRWLREEADRRGLLFVDLVAELRKLPSESVDAMFIPGHWHYSPKGNEWVAMMLRKRLNAHPHVSARLARLGTGQGSTVGSGNSAVPTRPSGASAGH